MSTLKYPNRLRSSENRKDRQSPPVRPGDLTLAELKERLGYSQSGLSRAEAEERMGRYGYNEIPEKKTNPFLKFLSYFWGPIPGMIIIAAVLSASLRHWPDLGVILALLILNAVVGFREEYQADNAIAALKARLALQAKVLRDGKWTVVAARELVPGDIVRLRIGDVVPADAKLLEGDPVEVDQSALTGESLPVEHKTGDRVYSGSIIRQGEIDVLVYATGRDTYYGKTAELVEKARSRSHFQRAVIRIADYLIVIAVLMAAIILMVALFRHDRLLEVMQFALVLTIAAVPVAMPAVLSVTMAIGARVLAQKEAIVTKLSSVEELAGIDVLCSDKTGTLTQNKLTLGDPFVIGDHSAEEVILGAALASRAENQDPIDLAVIAGVKDRQAMEGHRLLHFQPFDPVHKRTEAVLERKDGKTATFSKGAPQVILALDPDAGRLQAQVDEAVGRFAARGFRSLGVAQRDGSQEWELLGIIPLYDPLREDSRDTVEAAGRMGVQVKMVTGDQLAIAREIGEQLGLGKNMVNAGVFGDTSHHETGRLADAIERADGFAQVFPEHKYYIVDVLQQRGHIVGMTGDGVNDAPALKKADAGIAVAGATDAARAAADIVLMSTGLSVIIDAIKESRKTFQRMTNYAIYRITETIRVLLFMTLSILVFNFYPVTAIMIVLLAILNDGAILSIAYDNVRPGDKPEIWDMRTVLGLATVLGIAGVIASFLLFYLGERIFLLDQDTIQSLMYLKLSVAGHLTVFVARTRGRFWSLRPAPILLAAVLGTQLAATFIAVYGLFMAPVGWMWAGFVWVYALAWFLVNDQVKLIAYKVLSRNHAHERVKQRVPPGIDRR
ncbi:MAG: plasma-membrane proton-efflux P-type ATPase [Deltaproteobacteria bacterium]|nr:plasma-membrane proton-efflux P-type ATPase [Deltaproteobacteria bacterium]